jgi:hypothetical protein
MDGSFPSADLSLPWPCHGRLSLFLSQGVLGKKFAPLQKPLFGAKPEL